MNILDIEVPLIAAVNGPVRLHSEYILLARLVAENREISVGGRMRGGQTSWRRPTPATPPIGPIRQEPGNLR
jgi:hypothetical protein